MKKNLVKVAGGLIILLFLTGAAWAKDSFSITASCTIPVLPGLNAPLLKETATKTDITVTATQELPEEEIKAEAPQMIQAQTNEETTVQTLYVR